jgi:protein O-GlcNAc transferase
MIVVVSATRLKEAAFWDDTLLGRSLQQPQHRSLQSRISFRNGEPLAISYNAAITVSPADAVMVFCHDDLDLGPDPLAAQLEAALARFDLVGVAGNQRRQPGQMAWWLEGSGLNWDHSHLSGGLEHGVPQQAQQVVYGPTPAAVELLDGVFLAARAGRLQATGVAFDPQFAFHFYDLDLCRTARERGLRLGTWPLKLMHSSGGEAFNASWLEALERYQSKWQEPRRSPELDRHVLFHQARALERSARWAGAESLYRQLLTGQPHHSGLLLRLSSVQHQQGRSQEALATLAALIAQDPGLARAHANRGALLQLAGDLEGAEAAFRQALVLEPSLQAAADNLLLLARQLQGLGRIAAAVEAQRAVLRASPRRPDMLLDLGCSLMQQGKVDAARACFARLLRYHPQHPGAHYQMALAQESLGEMEEALELHQAALLTNPDSAEVLLALELVRLTLGDWHDYSGRMQRLHTALEAWLAIPGAAPLSPLRVLYFPLPLALQHRISGRWAHSQAHGQPTAPAALPPRQHLAPKDERLRIGYLSADFRNHAMGDLIHGLFAHHDRERFAVFAYSISDIQDAYTRSVQAGVEHFAVVAGESDEQLAARIRGDRLDGLIDLMGHTHHSRPGVLARRPAPLQLHYLGFPGSLGCSFIDGVIADGWLIPPEHESHYSETVHRLPWGFVSSPSPAWPAAGEPPTSASRERLGLPPKAVLYACFNRAEKITPLVFESWLAILQQAPQVVLWVINEQPRVQERLRGRLVAAGLEPERLIFSGTVDRALFGQLCGLADLLLDTSPYGSGATAVAALAAGLPLLTCPGETFTSRMGASLCAATGLEELICPTPEAYTAKAIELALAPEHLRQLSQQLREQHNQLPLFDTAGWVANLESLLAGLVAGDRGRSQSE